MFLWSHVGHISLSKEHPEGIIKEDKNLVKHITNPEKITQEDKELISNLNYYEIEFPVLEKDFSKIEVRNSICINVFGYKNELVFPIYVSDQTFEDSMDLLLLIDNGKSHYVYIKDFDRIMFHKTRNKNKKWFCRSCLQCFSSKNVLTKYKEDCLSINDKQSVKLVKGIIEFENYFKQMPVPFKIYADFECNLESTGSYEGSYTKRYQDHIPCSFAYKVVCVDNRFAKTIVVYRGENAAYEFIKAILKEYKYCKKVIKNTLTKI